MTTVVILQPSLWPWLGATEQIYRSDCFVFYCDVQYSKNDWRNRNRIKTSNGVQWLTVPVRHGHRFGERICDVEIDNNQRGWRKDHLKALELNYKRAPQFHRLFPELQEFYAKPWSTLEGIAEESIRLLCRVLGLERQFVCSRTLGIEGRRSGRLLKICKHFNASAYYSGAAAKDYLEREIFQQTGIEVTFQDYHHPTYPQLWGAFEPYLSTLDLLFNVEGAEALSIIRQGGSS